MIGAGIGFASGGGVAGARLGVSIGVLVGGVAESMLAKPQSIGRLDDIRITGSSFGVGIPWVYGRDKLPGNIIWWGDRGDGKGGLRETRHSTGSTLSFNRASHYEYSVDLAVQVCKGPITAIRKIWANDTLLYDVDAGPTLTPDWIRIYLGTSTQDPDPLIALNRSTYHGDEASAYRNTAYVVFENFNLFEYANQIPQSFRFLVENLPTYEEAVLTDSPLVFWRYENPPGKLVDLGSKGYTLTDPGSSTPIAGKYGSALSAPGASIDLIAPTGYDADLLAAALTVETWIQYKGGAPTGFGAARVNCYNPTPSNAKAWDLVIQPNLITDVINVQYIVDTAGTASYTTVHNYDLTRNTSWHHIAVTTTLGGSSMLYVDGVVVSTQTAPATMVLTSNPANELVVRVTDNIRVDETAIYSHILTPARIAYHYTLGPMQLSHILADVFQQVGLTPDQYDVSQAANATPTETAMNVRGLLIGDRTEARAAIDAALRCYFVDLVEADGKLVAVRRGGSIVRTIDADDLGAEMVESGLPDPKATLIAKRGQELELPRRVEILYTSEDTQYLAGNQDAKRYTKTHLQGELSLPTNLVFSNAEARLIAERLLYHAWIERETFEFSLPPAYLGLLPGDPVSLPIAGGTARVRLTRVDLALPGPLQCTAVLDEPTILTQEVLGGTSELNPDPETPCVETTLVAWNGNAMEDAHADSIGLYVAMNCSTPAVTLADAAAQFTGGPHLFHTQTGGEFSVPALGDMALDLWFEFDSLPVGAYIKIAGTEGGAVGTDGWYLQRDGATGLVTFGYSTGAAYKEIGTITPTTGVWYHGRFSYDHTGPTLSAVVQNTSTVLWSGTTSPVGAMNVSTQPLRLGFGVGGSTALIGRLDTVIIMGRLFAGGDLDLYNSGSGRKYTDFAGNPILTGMTACYNLDEASASVTWIDSHTGLYHFTQAGGSVLSVPKRGLF